VFSQLADVVGTGPIGREKWFLLKAHLACLLDGIQLAHISMESARRFRDVFADRLVSLGFLDASLQRTSVPLDAGVAWNEFGQTAASVGNESSGSGLPHKLSDLRAAEITYRAVATVTLAELHYYAGLIREGAGDLGLSSVDNIQEIDFNSSLGQDELRDCAISLKHRLLFMGPPPSGFLKGASTTTVWLAPVLDHVSLLVATTLASPDLFAKSHTNTLRDLLGLWKYNGPSTRPLAAFFFVDRRNVFAPNAITANGYERFRHRPRRFLRRAPTAGLTYHLDRRAARAVPGAAEIVTVDVKLTDIVDVIACGCPDAPGLTAMRLTDAHKIYSDYVSENRSLQTILTSLEAAIP
jgi:hypothetical protein